MFRGSLKPAHRDTWLTTLLLLGAVWLGGAFPAPGLAENGDTREQLQALRSHLKDLEKDLNASRGERDSLRDALRDTEQNIGGLLLNLKQLDASLRTETQRLGRLQQEDAQQRRQIRSQLDHLAKEARAAS